MESRGSHRVGCQCADGPTEEDGQQHLAGPSRCPLGHSAVRAWPMRWYSQGISVINISLPVRIFEPRSFLQRLSDVWQYAPVQCAVLWSLGAGPDARDTAVSDA